MRWTGNGVADGELITTANVNAAGNGDTVARAAGGSPVLRFAGDGFSVSGGAGDIGRIDMTLPAPGRAIVTQAFLTCTAMPTGAVERFINARSAGANSAYMALYPTGAIVAQANTADVSGSATPVIPLGTRMKVDMGVSIAAAPTTSNGRIWFSIQAPGWNGGTPWFFDSGETVNAGTALLSVVRFGKLATAVVPTANPLLLEQIGAVSVAAPAAGATRADLQALFMTSPYAVEPDPEPEPPTGGDADLVWTGTDWL